MFFIVMSLLGFAQDASVTCSGDIMVTTEDEQGAGAVSFTLTQKGKAFSFMLTADDSNLSGSGNGDLKAKKGASFVMIDPDGHSWPGSLKFVQGMEESNYLLLKASNNKGAVVDGLMPCKGLF